MRTAIRSLRLTSWKQRAQRSARRVQQLSAVAWITGSARGGGVSLPPGLRCRVRQRGSGDQFGGWRVTAQRLARRDRPWRQGSAHESHLLGDGATRSPRRRQAGFLRPRADAFAVEPRPGSAARASERLPGDFRRLAGDADGHGLKPRGNRSDRPGRRRKRRHRDFQRGRRPCCLRRPKRRSPGEHSRASRANDHHRLRDQELRHAGMANRLDGRSARDRPGPRGHTHLQWDHA